MYQLQRYLRTGHRILSKQRLPVVTQPVRKLFQMEIYAPQTYRDEEDQYAYGEYYGCAIGTYVLTMFLGWHFYHYPENYTGHYSKICPSKWTDEELGIPPDEEDIYPPGYIPLKDRIQ